MADATPYVATFDIEVDLQIESAHFTTAGLLLNDPVIHCCLAEAVCTRTNSGLGSAKRFDNGTTSNCAFSAPEVLGKYVYKSVHEPPCMGGQ